MSRIVGIDLGTTNSLIAYMDDGAPRVIPNPDGVTKVPSIVGMTDNGLIVGDPAKAQSDSRSRPYYLLRQALYG